MFIAAKEIKYFKGRLSLMAGVVTLLTLLTTFIAGLTGGLAKQNIDGILSIKDRTIIVQKDVKTLTNSTITTQDVSKLPPGKPLGVSQGNISKNSEKEGATLFATEETSKGKVALSEKIADGLNVKAGDSVTIAGKTFKVSKANGDKWYGHAPIAAINIDDWRAMREQMGDKDVYATALTNNSSELYNGSFEKYTKYSVLPIVGSFRSEIGSLLLIIGMLLTISSAVMANFIHTWNYQRAKDYTIIKALGGSTQQLVKAVLSQSAIALGVGVATGAAITTALALALRGTEIPYELSAATLLLPSALMFVAGLVGAAITLRPIAKTDPTKALEA